MDAISGYLSVCVLELRNAPPMQRSYRRTSNFARGARRGAVALWVIIATPALTALLVLVADAASLWQARQQLETAASSGALAGARVWAGNGPSVGDDMAAVNAAKTFTQANRILKNSLDADQIEVQLGLVNPAGMFLMGGGGPPGWNPPAGDQQGGNSPSGPPPFGPPPHVQPPPFARACRVRATMQIDSFLAGFAGPYTLQASATAVHDQQGTRLVRIGGVSEY
jgi:hypothetical protein